MLGSHNGTRTMSDFNYEHWKSYAKNASLHIKEKWNDLLHPLLHQDITKDRIFILYYENILNKRNYHNNIRHLLQFMNYTYSHDRSECAYVLSDKPFAHRHSMFNITYAYDNIDLVCYIWRNVFYFSRNFNYTIWRNLTCSMLPYSNERISS
jgi:hypothetical protein